MVRELAVLIVIVIASSWHSHLVLQIILPKLTCYTTPVLRL